MPTWTVENSLPDVEAYTVGRFCAVFGVGKTFVYAQIKTQKLRAVKTGARTLILRRDAEAWVKALPPVGIVK